MRPLAVSLLCGLVLSGAGPLRAEITVSRVEALTQGIFCSVETTGSSEAPGTIAGAIDHHDKTPEFLWLDRTVPAAIGISFGLHITVSSDDAGPITYEVEHPPMGPEAIRVERWDSELSAGGPQYSGFQLEKPYELAEGPWYFRAFRDEEMLYEARFDLVPPEARPDIMSTCLGQNLLS